MQRRNGLSVRTMSLSAVMTAVMCITAPITIPVGVVPISITNFTIMLSTIILGAKMGMISCIIYITLGLVGLPVFSGFSGGAGKLAGPTGGYIVGFILLSAISGLFIEKFPKNKALWIVGMFAGIVAMYVSGTVWLSVQAKTGFISALTVGVVPFVGWDIIKVVLAVIIGDVIKKRLVKAKILLDR